MTSHSGQFVFRFKKNNDTREMRDLAAIYLAAILSPDPVLGRPQSNDIYQNTREVSGTLGWVCEHISATSHYQLGRANDYFMNPVDDRGTWRVSHRYFKNETLAAARTLFLHRFSDVVEDASGLADAA